jgi:hypothetical protein
MNHSSIEKLLDQLEEAKRRFDKKGQMQISVLLKKLFRSQFQDAALLVRFHEILLFIRAYPANETIFKQSENLLDSFLERVELLGAKGSDMSPLDYAEVSGIVGTVVSAAFSYKIAQWFVQQFVNKVEIDWESYKKKDRLGVVLPRILPLLDEDSLVEANVPYMDWFRAAKPATESDLSFLLGCFDALPVSEKEKAELYDSLELPIFWQLENSRFSRTRMRVAARKVFYHTTPLIERKEVSLADEFASPPLHLKKLSAKEGAKLVNLARASSASRYRELFGFTHGDAAHLTKSDLGRGIEVFIYELPPENRLPLRAYHAGMIFKNGIAIGYVETLSLFERTEIGFNLYYTFREGETAWLYARLLKLFHQLFGATYFSIDPYQIGFHNQEAIESGAFWFYRKLGFRPVKQDILRLVQNEEKKIQTRKGYRTPARTLRKIAESHVVFDIGEETVDWSNFQVRNLGIAMQKRMAQSFRGNQKTMRENAAETIANLLDLQFASWNVQKQQAFENLALMFTLVNDMNSWSTDERELAKQIIQAKLQEDESKYLRLLQKHERLRQALITIGS